MNNMDFERKNIILGIVAIVFAILIVFVFSSAGYVFAADIEKPRVSTQPASDIEATSATLKGYVDANGIPTVYWFEWGLAAGGLTNKSAEYNIGSGTSAIYVLFGSSELKENSLYFFRLVARNDGGVSYGSTKSFETKNIVSGVSGKLPRVSTNSAKEIGVTKAILKGTVDPEGFDTYAWFEWGKASSNLSSETSRRYMGSGTRSVGYLISLAGLSEDTTYFYRAVAKNDTGTVYGTTYSFKTKEASQDDDADDDSTLSCNVPLVFTVSAGTVSNTSAVLKGTVNPRNHNTRVWFEYGKSPSLDNNTSWEYILSYQSEMNVNKSVSGLLPGTKYYFKIFAENDCGKVSGAVQNFITTGFPAQSQPDSQNAVLSTSRTTYTQYGNGYTPGTTNTNSGTNKIASGGVVVFAENTGFDTDILIPSVSEENLDINDGKNKKETSALGATLGFFSSGVNILFLMVFFLLAFAGFYFYQTHRQYYRLIKEA